MIVNQGSLDHWEPRMLNDSLAVDLTGFNEQQLQQFNDKLTEYVESQPHISEVTLSIHPSILNKTTFQNILETLKSTSLMRLTLQCPSDAINESLVNLLNEHVVPQVHFPVIINPPNHHTELKPFESRVISQIQQYNQAKLRGETQAPPSSSRKTAKIHDEPIPLKKLIHTNAIHAHEFDNFITVEAQHVEEDEEQQNIAQNIEEAVTLTAEEENQDINRYEGDMIDFLKFKEEPYRSKVIASAYPEIYDVFKYEIFGDRTLAKAIHFLSPKAAHYIAEHAGALATFNITNLPNHLVLKKTEKNMYVLDFDPEDTEDLNNPFTPKVTQPYQESAPIYQVTLPPSTQRIIKDLNFTEHTLALHNVWIRYGDLGIESLLSNIQKLDDNHPGLSQFIIEHYLKKFPHWDRLLEDHSFLDTLTQISQYDDIKLQCLKEFLEQTDSTQFNLMDTTYGFEAFWSQWSTLAQKNNLALHEINSRCMHRPCGSPLVYMERLITILNHARDVKEQLTCFHDTDRYTLFKINNQYYAQLKSMVDGGSLYADHAGKTDHTRYENKQLDREVAEKVQHAFLRTGAELQLNNPEYSDLNQHVRKKLYHTLPYSLDNYGDYYASHIEGFHLVSHNMGFRYLGAELFGMRDEEPNTKPKYRVNIEDIDSPWEIEAAFKMAGYSHSVGNFVVRNKLPDASINTKKNLFLINATAQHITEAEFATLRTKPYNPDDFYPPYQLYVQDPESGEFEKLLSKASHYHNLFCFDEMQRYIGQQAHGISPPVFQKALNKLRDKSYDEKDRQSLALNCLFLMAHEGYQGVYDPFTFLDNYYNTRRAPESFIFGRMNFWMRSLHERGIHLTEIEGALICQHLERLPADIDIPNAIKTLFVAIQDNPYATLNSLRLLPLPKGQDVQASLPHILDTPEMRSESKKSLIHEEFLSLGDIPWVHHLETTFLNSNWVTGTENQDKLRKKIHQLTVMLDEINKQPCFIEHQVALSSIFIQANLKEHDFETLRQLFTLLKAMPTRDYTLILKDYFNRQEAWSPSERQSILKQINTMHLDNLPSPLIQRLIQFLPAEAVAFNTLRSAIAKQLQNNPQDPFVAWMLTNTTYDVLMWNQILQLTQYVTKHNDGLCMLFKFAAQQGDDALLLLMKNLESISDEKQTVLLELLAKSCAQTLDSHLQHSKLDVTQLCINLNHLTLEELSTLNNSVDSSNINILSLDLCLKQRINASPNEDFNDFLMQFEKNPFGKRPSNHYDTSQVERVINGFVDLNHNTAYPYHYRKQMMEAFLFVNHAGKDLPIYNQKAAQELSNQELRDLFQSIKQGKFNHLGGFNKRLYALGLMREAIYRSTGQFPYSTQMIALIDCMMHEGDVIQNIDTGQGKSLIDTLKATLLYLESDRVDISTASLVDAKRDLDVYRPFFSLLGIPQVKSPISAASTFEEISQPGIHYTTMANMALCMAKIQSEGLAPPGWDKDLKVSLVLNESDYTILDDQTIYRFATLKGDELIHQNQEWVYQSINEFVNTPQFRSQDTGKNLDIKNLREYLLRAAKSHKQSGQFIQQISDQQMLTWINSAIMVNYRLQENIDYILTEHPEDRKIRGIMQKTRRAKIIMKDGKISSDTQYGNGMQQLLYAKINQKLGYQACLIEPESKTILSLNNKNMINYYRSKQGFIWGSSGTVGVGQEIDSQFKKFQFELSKVDPHQKKIVKTHPITLFKNEADQFKAILKQLNPNKKHKKEQAPILIMFKDIPTAKRFHAFLNTQCKYEKPPRQLYTGESDEKQAVLQAAIPGTITITTSALGRNTDIPYNRNIGLTVIETSAEIPERQKIQRTGRTGRQGSEGNVYTILNKTDLKGRTLKEVKLNIEQAAEKVREHNERLYDILDALRACINIEDQDQAFFKRQWSGFSEQVEIKYNELNAKKQFEIKAFLNDIVLLFNSLDAAKTPTTIDIIQEKLNQTHQKRKAQVIFLQPITQADCISADIIAYHFIPNQTQTEDIPEQDKIRITTHVQKVLASKKDFAKNNRAYLQYLNTNPKNMQQIKAIHQKVLNEYLEKQTSLSTKRTFIARWLGFKSPLSRLANDQAYLLLFKTLMNVDSAEKNDAKLLSNIQSALNILLLEYIQSSWFVSTSKKTATIELIKEINRTENIEEIMAILSKGKMNILKQDMQRNQTQIKPINQFGSRFQDTLDRALQLTQSLTNKPLDRALITELSVELNTLKKGNHISSEIRSIDDIKSALKTAQFKDNAHAVVITKSIESNLEHTTLESSRGMIGRFKQKIHSTPTQDDLDSNSSKKNT